MRRIRSGGASALALLGLAGCGASSAPPAETLDASTPPPAAVRAPRRSIDASDTGARLGDLRARFAITPAAPPRLPGSPREDVTSTPRPVIAAGVVERFVRSGDRLRPLVTQLARRGVIHAAVVELPITAAGEVALEDDAHLAVRFALAGAREAEVETADGLALYRRAIDGADVLHRVHAEGTEDYVVFEAKPAREELAYRVDVSQVAGLRLVSNVAEFLDVTGTPRLRIASPYVVDALGARREAKLAIEGCAYDMDTRAPWGRGVTAPGAKSCVVRVTWGGVTYPAIVDPVWSATGAMTTARYGHTASVLSSGRVLVAGGWGPAGAISAAELFDPNTNTFGASAALAGARFRHSATLLASGKVLVAGGVGSTWLSTAELYDAGANAFSPAGALSSKHSRHTASLLPTGKVLVVAGEVSGAIEQYDAGSNAFSLVGNCGARYGHSTTVLASGKALIIGGQAAATVESTALLYDPGVGVYVAGSMTSGRAGHTAHLLPSGNVLVLGGSSGNSGA